MAVSDQSVQSFITRWSNATPSERANSQLFLAELCDLLGVDRPDPTHNSGYSFEQVITEHHVDGTTSSGRIDLYVLYFADFARIARVESPTLDRMWLRQIPGT